GGTRFVEGDVAVGAHAQDLQVDTAEREDALLEVGCRRVRVVGVAGRQHGGIRGDAPRLQDVLGDVVAVALRVAGSQADVLVGARDPQADEVQSTRDAGGGLRVEGLRGRAGRDNQGS